jgi:putative transcriptional regulator
VSVPDSLRGQLLVASPALQDFFHRAVVLVVEHSDEGALGVVLNRPSETRVSEAVPALAALAGGDELVRVGGPVSPQAVVALGEFEDPEEAATGLADGLGLVDPDASNVSVRRARVYAGHAGWGPGQLDGELEQEAWIVAELRPDDPFRDDDLWPVALQRKGGGYALLATMPPDPSLN